MNTDAIFRALRHHIAHDPDVTCEHGTRLRLSTTTRAYCPLTYLALRETGQDMVLTQYADAGTACGIDAATIEAIAAAADIPTLSNKGDGLKVHGVMLDPTVHTRLRRRLLYALRTAHQEQA